MAAKSTVVLFHPKLNPADAGQVHFTPLSVLSVAGPLIRENINVVIVDSNFGERFEDKGICLDHVVCVGISAMTGYQIQDGIEFTQSIKTRNKGIPVVWGGVHVSLLPEQSVRSQWVDYVVVGQGEVTFLELVKAFQHGTEVENVAGVLFERNGEIIRTAPRPFVDINELPPVPYHLLDMEAYFDETKTKTLRSSDAFLGKLKRFLYFYSSVGCPYKCKFCASSKIVAAKWTALKAERVVDEVASLVEKYNINCLQFCDAEFFIDRKRAKAIAQGFIDRGLNLAWKAQVRANIFDQFDDDMMNILKKSGYTHVEIGVESGSPRMLEFIAKGITVEQVERCAEKIKKYGMFSSFCHVFGFPGETAEDVRKSFKLASRLKELLPNCLLPVYFFDPYPAVPLFEESLKYGMVPPKNFKEWAQIKPDMREPSPLASWQTKKFMDQVHRVIIFYLPLAYPADIGLGTMTYVKSKMERGKWKYIMRLAHRLALWRVRGQFFGFPVEWELFKVYRRFKALAQRVF